MATAYFVYARRTKVNNDVAQEIQMRNKFSFRSGIAASRTRIEVDRPRWTG